MVNSGMSTFEALAMALFVYAGSSQLAAIPLLVAGAPVWVILSTGFCVNLRFVVFSLHLRAYLIHLPRLERFLYGYLTSDINYVIFTRRHPQAATNPVDLQAQIAYFAGTCCVGWMSWMGASFAGIFLTKLIPVEWGLGFAGILCLIGITCSLVSTKMRIVACTVAAIAAIVAYAAPFRLNIVIAIAASVLLCLGLEQFKKTHQKGMA